MDRLNVHLLPVLTSAQELAGGTVVVIDVLRATTTMVHALAAGAVEVIACLEIEEARRLAASVVPGKAVLGGERGGLPIAGFDLGNSPEEYSAAAVGNRSVVLTTTNGTRALDACRRARRVLVAGFVNSSAVIDALACEAEIDLLCAGTRGQVSLDDVLLAGSLAEGWMGRRMAGVKPGSGTASDETMAINDSGRLALAAWQAVNGGRGVGIEAGWLAAALEQTQGGRDLVGLGLRRDIEAAARVDRFPVLAEMDMESWRLRRAAPGS